MEDPVLNKILDLVKDHVDRVDEKVIDEAAIEVELQDIKSMITDLAFDVEQGMFRKE